MAGFPGLVKGAKGGGNVLGELRAGGGVDGIWGRNFNIPESIGHFLGTQGSELVLRIWRLLSRFFRLAAGYSRHLAMICSAFAIRLSGPDSDHTMV